MQTHVTTQQGSERLSEQASGTAHLHRHARARGGFLVSLLVGILLVAMHPEWLPDPLLHVAWASEPVAPIFPASQLLRCAGAANEQGKLVQATRYYGYLCQQHPEHPAVERAYVQRLSGLIQLQDYEEAEKALREFLSRFPHNDNLPRLLLQQAGWEFDNARFSAAVETYTELIGFMTLPRRKTLPSEDTAPAFKSNRRALLAEAKRVAKRNNVERLARFNLALSYEANDEDMKAARAYARFLQRFPLDNRALEAHFCMAIIHLNHRNFGQSLVHFAEIYSDSLAPQEYRNPSIYYAGRCYEKQQNLAAAVAVYELADLTQPLDDPFRLQALTKLALLLEQEISKPAHKTLAAEGIYQDLTQHSASRVLRAVAQQHLRALREPSGEVPRPVLCENAAR